MQYCICTSATSGHINQSVSKKNAFSAHGICQTVLTTFKATPYYGGPVSVS